MGERLQQLGILLGELILGRDPMRTEEKEARRIARETGGDPSKIAEAYRKRLPEISTEGSKEADGS